MSIKMALAVTLLTIQLWMATSFVAMANPGEVVMELIHRHDHRFPGAGPPLTRLERMRDLLGNDMERRQLMRGRHLAAAGRSVLMPISTTKGAYVVTMRVGTPPQKLTLIADTGSHVIWIRCMGSGKRLVPHQLPRTKGFKVFTPWLSRSFTPIPCSSNLCNRSELPGVQNGTCPVPTGPCLFQFHFVAEAIDGYYAKETIGLDLTNGQQINLRDVPIGCNNQVDGHFDGLVGLGFNASMPHFSFMNSATKQLGGGKFYYCLVHYDDAPKAPAARKRKTGPSAPASQVLKPRSYLQIGGSSTNHVQAPMRYTQLLLLPPYYCVSIQDMSVGGAMLRIPFNKHPAAGQKPKNSVGENVAVVDSGTTLTFLAPRIFEPLVDALMGETSYLSRFKPVNREDFEVCFDSSVSVTGRPIKYQARRVPKIAFHFADGTVFEPQLKGYIIDVDHAKAPHVKCLAILEEEEFNDSTLGSFMQSEFLWEFDLQNRRLGFAPSTCQR